MMRKLPRASKRSGRYAATLVRRLCVVAVLLAAFVAGGLASAPPAHAATTTAAAPKYGYDSAATVVQQAFGSPIRERPLRPGGPRLQARSAPSRPAREEGIAAEAAPRAALRGEFSIVDWTGYPAGVAKPTGPVRLLTGEEYAAARASANRANAQLRRANPELYRGKQIHEIHPVKFGGSPTDPANKIALTPEQHYALNAFWRHHQLYAEGGP